MLKITASGRLTRDAELRYTPKKQAVLNFTLALDIGYGENKTTEYLECALWGERGEKVGEYLTKGRQVFVIGDGFFRSWNKGSKSGVNYCCNVDSLEFGSLPKAQTEEKGECLGFPPGENSSDAYLTY